MTRQDFHTIDVCRLEVAVKPTTPHNLVANPDGALGAWGWVTPGASYMRKASGSNTLEHVSAGGATVFYTEPMPITAGHYAAAAFSAPTAPSSFTWQVEWLDSAYAVVSAATASGSITTTGVHSRPAVQAPAGAAFFRLRFNQAGAGTVALTSVRAATATTSAALAGTITRNLVPNPSFEVDTASWTAGTATTMVRTTAAAHVGAASLHLYRSLGNPGAVSASTVVGVTGGLDYTLQARFRAQVSDGWPMLTIQWLDGGGTTLDASGASHAAGAFDLFSITHTAPPGATQARLTVAHTVPGPGNAAGAYVDAVAFTAGSSAYFDGSTPASGTLTYAWEGAAHNSVSKATDTNLTTLAAVEWRNILGPTHTISTARESLNVGTLEAQLLDANLDPATSSTLRPGGAVRVLALVGGVWEPTFVGEIDRLLVTYDDKRRPIRPPRVSMTAVDRTRRLTGARRTQGVAAVASLPHVLEGAGVPWNVDGSTAQLLTAPATASVNDNATALDQVALTRDSTASHAWVDRKGVLVATTAAAGAAVRVLNEPRYSDLEVAFASDECINAVVIEALTVVDDTTPTGGTFQRSESVTYGPYEDRVSIASWGRRERTFTVHGLSASQVATLGAAILTRNANPGVTVREVTLPMRSAADLVDTLRDLGEIVQVVNTARGISPNLRVTSVSHTIESAPEKWLVRLGFSGSGSVAAPTVQPEITSARGFEDTAWLPLPFVPNGGWADYDTTTYGPCMYQRRNGIVYLSGLAKTTVPNYFHLTMANLPPGFRPRKDCLIRLASSTTPGAETMYITSAGQMYFPGASTTVPSQTFASIVTSFPAAQ